MQKWDSISVFLCSVINYSHFKRCFKNRRMPFDAPNTIQPIVWKHLLCFEISVDVYAVCVFSGRVVNFQHKNTA